MYVATFICDDRNGEDGIYGTEWNTIGAHRFATLTEAMQAIADDADSHARMYEDTAERHWHGAFYDAATRFATDDAHAAANFATANGGGYLYYVNGSDDGNGEPWTLGHYRIHLDADTPHVARTASGATVNLTNAQCERLRTACDVIREDDDADDAERAAIATLCDDLYRLLTPTPTTTTACADCAESLSTDCPDCGGYGIITVTCHKCGATDDLDTTPGRATTCHPCALDDDLRRHLAAN